MTKSVFSVDYDRFCALLTAARVASGLTQTELSERLCRPQSFVSKYERGERRLDVIEFIEVANAIGADPVSLLKGLL